MEFSATVEVATSTPITFDQADDLAEIGGSAAIWPDRRRYSVTFTTEGRDIATAGTAAAARALKVVPGEVLALEVLTLDETDPRLAEPAFPELVGVAEIVELFGVTRQRASALQ